MKLAILKFVVYFMGLLLVMALISLGYIAAQKIKNPNWSPINQQNQSIAQKIQNPVWPKECLNKDRQITILNKDSFIISNPHCPFYDIFDSHGRFINRIQLKGTPFND